MQIAGAVALRDVGDARARGARSVAEITQAMSDAPTSARPSASSVAVTIGCSCWRIVGQRQRDADERDRRMLHRHRDVEHVDLQRGAVAGAIGRGR